MGLVREVEDEPFSDQAKGAVLIAGGQEMPGCRTHPTRVSQVLGGPLMQAPLAPPGRSGEAGPARFLDQLVVPIGTPSWSTMVTNRLAP